MVTRFVAGVSIAALALSLAPAASASNSAKPLTSAQCLARVNDTVPKLVECVRTADLWQHMQKFQAIADANLSPADRRPSRNSGEPGYKASADYVAQVMGAAGYNVTIQTYTFTYYAFTGIPTWSESSPFAHTFALSSEWNPGQSTGSTTDATLQPAGGIIIPPTPTPSSSSGCTAADFSGFVTGRIALIQRGSCFFGVKVLNAQAAGASGVVIFNEGNTPARSGVLSGSLLDANGNPIIPTIPVAFTSFAIGDDLYNAYNGLSPYTAPSPLKMSLSIPAIFTVNTPAHNVIPQFPGGGPN